ncbi:aldehyde dehydrogenase family protein [Sciscionella marina]|uniref:aldehyde dehydrogenase family protein n=1 Tax=Sciscionella marina TaxID=508770 RepID=UPI001969C84B|nr:aldehyde dehydrogenase family protein [Sciscionella marina]
MHSAPSAEGTGSPGSGPPAMEVSVDPASPDRIVHTFHPAGPGEVRAAIDAAEAAAPEWAAAPPLRRASVLDGIADRLEQRGEQIASLITAEEGKPIGAARGEVAKSVEQFRLAAQLAYLVEGTTYPAETQDTFAYTLRTPLGVVAAITPWNFPVSLAARKIAPALAVGNAVVFKPSPITAATGALLAELARDAGTPEGVLPVVQGQDNAAMDALLQDERVRAVSFTGSDATGAVIRTRSSDRVRLQLELGGRNAAVVGADADLAAAAKAVAAGAFGLTGQACTSTDRVLVAEPVVTEFTDLLAAEVRRLRVGQGTQDGVTSGPVATAAQFARLSRLRESAVAAGARPAAQAQSADGNDPDGYWITPTLFTDVPEGHPLVTDEVFGPFCSVLPVRDVEEALAVINASTHGLVAGVHTVDLSVAHRFAAAARCGLVKVNSPTTGNGVAPPFGGWNASAGGAFPEGGRQAIDFVTETKTVYLNHGGN